MQQRQCQGLVHGREENTFPCCTQPAGCSFHTLDPAGPPAAFLNAAAVAIGAVVGFRFQELINQVACRKASSVTACDRNPAEVSAQAACDPQQQ